MKRATFNKANDATGHTRLLRIEAVAYDETKTDVDVEFREGRRTLYARARVVYHAL